MIQLQGAGKRFGHKLLFEDCDWLITPRERTGLVGGNGTGKSTLLKILCGMETLDYGSLSMAKGLTIGFLPQDGLSLKGRTDLIIGSLWNTTSGPTGTYERAYQEAHTAFGAVLSELRDLHQRTQALEDQLERQGAPYTPGRMPLWEDAK